MQSIEAYFDHKADDYQQRSSSGIWRVIRKRESTAVLALLAPLNSSWRVLDLGSGSGFYANFLYEKGIRHLTCVDYSQNMLNKISVSYITKIKADLQEYIDTSRFNLIICAGALEFASEPQKVLCNMKAMLEKDGKIILLVPSPSLFTLGYKIFHFMNGLRVQRFSRKKVINLAQTAQLKVTGEKRAPPLATVYRLEHR